MCSCRAWRRWRSSYHLRFIAYVWHRAQSHPAGGKQWQVNLGFQRVDARQRLALQPFEERAARGRDKGEIVRYAGLVERRDRIAAARDRDQRSFARQRRGGPGERDGRSVEGRRLERAERAVPYQREIGSASCRVRVCKCVYITMGPVTLKKKQPNIK